MFDVNQFASNIENTLIEVSRSEPASEISVASANDSSAHRPSALGNHLVGTVTPERNGGRLRAPLHRRDPNDVAVQAERCGS